MSRFFIRHTLSGPTRISMATRHHTIHRPRFASTLPSSPSPAPSPSHTSTASSSSTSSSSPVLFILCGITTLNALMTGYVLYVSTTSYTEKWKALESHLDFGMDRIDECLNRIDLRNNETTGYFQTVSKKVEELESLKQQQQQKDKKGK